MGHRLRKTAQRLTGLPDKRIGLSLFANEATVHSLIQRGGVGSQPWQVGAAGCLHPCTPCSTSGWMAAAGWEAAACFAASTHELRCSPILPPSPPLPHTPQASLELLNAELVVVGVEKEAADLAMRCEFVSVARPCPSPICWDCGPA